MMHVTCKIISQVSITLHINICTYNKIVMYQYLYMEDISKIKMSLVTFNNVKEPKTMILNFFCLFSMHLFTDLLTDFIIVFIIVFWQTSLNKCVLFQLICRSQCYIILMNVVDKITINNCFIELAETLQTWNLLLYRIPEFRLVI